MTSRTRCTAITVLLVALTGCRFFSSKAKQPEPAPLPLPAARPVEAKPPTPTAEPPGPPPKIDAKTPEVPPTVAVIPTPPAPKPNGRRQPRKPALATGVAQTPAAAQAPPPTTATVETAAPAAMTNPPVLGEILTDDQRLQYLRICDESLARAHEALGQLRGLTLSPDQKQALDRVKIFIAQAQQARQKDPQTAKQLAERADLLSRDLVRTAR